MPRSSPRESRSSFFSARGQRFEVRNAKGVAFLHTGCIMAGGFRQRSRSDGTHAAAGRPDYDRAGRARLLRRHRHACRRAGLRARACQATTSPPSRQVEPMSTWSMPRAAAAHSNTTTNSWQKIRRGRSARARIRKAGARHQRGSRCNEPRTAPHAIDATITYQEPCHLVHAQRVSAAPRRLLALIPGGAIGRNGRERRLLRKRRDLQSNGAGNGRAAPAAQGSAIVRTGAKIVVTANPGCAMQVTAGLRDAGYSAERQTYRRTARRRVRKLAES